MRLVLTAAALLGGIAIAGSARADAVDYVKDARLYYRAVTCSGTEPVPATLDTPTVTKHCEEMAKRFARFTETYIQRAQPFFAGVRPAGLPQTVVYPFGGGDLVSALVTYPDAQEITTISLEHAGDPTRLAAMTDKKQLGAALQAYRDAIYGLLTLNDSTSENMRKLEKGGIPGQLSFHLTGMAVMGYEPVSLRFFQLKDDGSIAYLSQADIDALAATKARKVKHGWVDTDFSEAFNHMELVFRKAGDPKAPTITHRHIAGNLADKAFKGSPLEKHLLAKGKIAALTKAASFLIWEAGFSGIRDYLLANMAWMASDATGIPPRFARKAGFKQVTYGTFKGPFLPEANGVIAEEMVKLWESQPRRRLGFRYGYVDSELGVHLMITQPAPPPEPKKK
ncbi:MAG TPA: hypothetical protein VNO30_39805 [Kofleriaceae bacterium]|nr:hypothetical protein [Kofleriaceae bacterium]